MLRARRRKPAADVVVLCRVPDCRIIALKFLCDGQAYQLANGSISVMLNQQAFRCTVSPRLRGEAAFVAPHTGLPSMAAIW